MASPLTSEALMHSLLDFADLQALAIAQLADIDNDQYLLINLDGPCPAGTELTKGRSLADKTDKSRCRVLNSSD